VKEFWTSKDFECLWKIQKNRQRNHCDRCGVEVTEKKCRDRVGHINLVVPIAHIWYFRSLPKIGYILGLPSKKLDDLLREIRSNPSWYCSKW
jgi:DNA-directed RNA polymerase beta' subunit